MKNNFKYFVLLLAAVLLLASCKKSDIPGYKVTKSGLHYKIDKVNKSGEKFAVGDIVVGEFTLRMDDKVLTSNVGNPGRIYRITESEYHDAKIDEGLLMLHVGDKASFAIFADSIFRFFDISQMPEGYTQGKGQIIYWDFVVTDRVSAEEFEQERTNFYSEMQAREAEEPNAIKNYLAKNNINVAPTSNGVYVVVHRKGKGNTVGVGKKVSMNYTGRLLDGTVFDSSIESIAREAGLQRGEFKPLEYVVGKERLIKGWEEGINALPEGSEVTLIIPSNMAYGPMGSGDIIPPYSPLVFDIQLLAVK